MYKTEEKAWLLSGQRQMSSGSARHGQSAVYNVQVKVLPQLIAAAIAYLGSLSTGFALGYSSPAIPDLEVKFKLNAGATSWFGSLVTLGAVLGGVLSGYFMEQFGRKTTLLMANLPLVVGYGIIAGVESMAWLYVGRTLTGIGMGMMAITVNIYIVETATAQLRGPLGTGAQIFIGSGIFLSYVLGISLNYVSIALGGAIIAALMSLLILIIPESPTWSIMKNRYSEATKALIWLRGSDANVNAEILNIKQNLSNQPETCQLSDLTNPRYFKPLLIAVILNMLQKLVGINAVEFYTESIFQAAGYAKGASIPPVIISLVSIFGTIPSVLLVERKGRKAMLIFSGILTCTSCIGLGVFYYLYEERHVTSISWLPVVCLMIYNFGFSMGWGPVAWLVGNEILPNRIRGFGGGLTSVINWLTGFLVSKEFPELVAATSHYVGFWLFAGMSIIAILYVVIIVPETKGKTLDEIEQYFIPSARETPTERPSKEKGCIGS